MGYMIRGLIACLFILLFGFAANAQSWNKNLSVGSPNLNTSAIFQVESTTKGAIANPKVTTTQRNAISSPTEGLGVWDTTADKRSDYDGSNWIYHVYETRTQTLTNKTIDGDTNTVQDLALTSLKTTANNNVFIGRNGSGVAIDTTKAIPSGTVVGTSDAQALTNKDIDGGTASNSLRITVPKNTKTNLDGLTRKEGTILYATDTQKFYVDDGSNLLDIAEGGTTSIGEITFANYATNSGQTINATATVINFEDIIEDANGLVTVGGSWVYTVPETAIYLISAKITLDDSNLSNSTAIMFLLRNGSEVTRTEMRFPDHPPAGDVTISVADFRRYTAGDTIQITAQCADTDAIALDANPTKNRISIIGLSR